MLHKNINKTKKIVLISLAVFTMLLISFVVYFKIAVTLSPPEVSDLSSLKLERQKIGRDYYKIGNNWIRKNKYGLWEMYVEGSSFERGVVMGKLSKELIYKQESAFVDEINKIVPSSIYLYGLKLFVAWFNRDLNYYVNDEYKKEIFGVSESASGEFDYIASNYQRILNYHAAHDIGHALQGMNFVGCTSFSVWASKSSGDDLIVGRNFDFYVGDEFAKNKIVCFMKPSNGYKFMMVTWGGMIGVVSGMNEKGLTVTLNAAKSKIPMSAATPISIIAREILQYSGNIKEAFNIAKKRKSFVSESIMVGSLNDNKTVLIEKTPYKTSLFYSNTNYIICSNHYQSKDLKDTKLNKENIKESTSEYRYNRMKELLDWGKKISYLDAASILRDQKGLNDKDIGIGNEKAINQLIAHHSIIFEPAKLLVWVSSNPYQLGAYAAYDLKKIFSMGLPDSTKVINEESLTYHLTRF